MNEPAKNNIVDLSPAPRSSPPSENGDGGGGSDRDRISRLEGKVDTIEKAVSRMDNVLTRIDEKLNHMPTTLQVYKIIGGLFFATLIIVLSASKQIINILSSIT